MAVVNYPAGTLRHSVIVEAMIVVKQPDFTQTRTWTPDPVPWRASIQQLNATERFEAQQIQADATHAIKGRYYPGLTPTHRLKFGSRTFNIVSVNNVEEANVNHELRCMEVV